MTKLIYGSDFSSYQAPKPDMTGWGFAYVKATEGTTYINPNLVSQSTHVENTVKQRGYYHYMQPGYIKEQAQFFVNTVGLDECKDPYVELWLDFEEDALTGDEPKIFMDEVKRLTGKQCGFYTSQSWLTSSKYDWSDLPKNTPLWVAMYPSNERAGNNLTQSELQWGYDAFAKIHHFNQVDVWQFGAGSGFDWNVRFSAFPNQSTPKPSEPKKGQVLTLKKDAYRYTSDGKKHKYPAGKESWFKANKGYKVTYMRTVGSCYEVEFYGEIMYFHKGNF